MILIFIGVFYMYPYIQISLNQIEAYNEINAEDLFNATDLVISALEDVILKSNSKLN